MDWNKAYGPDGDAYPVQPGEVWAVGPHMIACLDHENERRAAEWTARLSAEGGCSMVFMDPPWNSGNARSFRTKAGLDGAQGRAVDFPGLLRRIVRSAALAAPRAPLWIEMGNAAAPAVQDLLDEEGYGNQAIWPVFYYRNKPCSLIRAGFTDWPPDVPIQTDEPVYTAFAIAADSKPGQRVLDLCAGRGLTATCAAEAGRVFRGAELNPRRVSVTLSKLARLTRETPRQEAAL